MAESYARLAVTVTLESPLSLGERKPGGQAAPPLDYLPGARLRGAVAELLLDEGSAAGSEGAGAPDARVGALFAGDRPAIFRDALPGTPEAAGELLPATAVSCKRHAGFRSGGGRRAGHGVFDTLLDRAFLETLKPAGLLYRPRCATPGCMEWAERFGGHYSVRGAGSLRYFQVEVPRRLLARVALDRRRRVAADELLYTVPVLSEAAYGETEDAQPTVFHGEVLVPDDADGALLRDALGRVDHLGGGGSRGLGAVQVSTAPAAAPETSLAARLELFRGAVARRREQYARLAPLSVASLEGAYFSVDLRSDALLRRQGWAPTTVLDADLLRAAAGVDDPSLTLVRAYAAPAWRGGWNAAWGLPRPTELAAARGSCYLFRTTDLAAWNAALEALEWQGIGLRTAEGYGRVHVCDPFHLVLREQAV